MGKSGSMKRNVNILNDIQAHTLIILYPKDSKFHELGFRITVYPFILTGTKSESIIIPSGPSCSKLTMLLINVALKFQMLI